MRILIVTGGTGGHIFPAISLAQKIKSVNPFSEIIFCVDRRVDEKLLEKFNFKYYILDTPKMPYGIGPKWILFFFRLMFSFSQAKKILNETKPNVVMGFGAYVSGPILAQAKRQKKRIIIHEQNVMMGRANLILSKTADNIAIGFKNAQYLKDKRAILTGNPIRDELLEDLDALNKERARRLLELDFAKTTALVMGGSLGSRIINNVFLGMLNSLPKAILKSLQIIHLTGKSEFDNVQSEYKNIDVTVNIYPFYERMGLLYKASDFIICRAGAITLSEVCVFGLPAILIPYRGAGAHQRHNAAFLQQRKAAIVIDEKYFTPAVLKNSFMSLFDNKDKLSEMETCAKSLGIKDAAERLADIVLNF